MKVYISADLEGVAGIVHSDQTDPAQPEYQYSRKLMVREVNAAVEGALAAGADEILVNDSHWHMRNIIAEDLHPAAILLSGSPKPYSMMTGIDKSFDAVFFTGYHARADSSYASIDHTYYGPNVVQDVSLNGVPVGEYGINAALAGYFGVPVVLLTGDQTVCQQAKDLLGQDLTTVAVKESIGRTSAKSPHPSRVCEMIKAAAERALKSRREPFVLQPPITLRLGLARSSQADQCELIPNVRRISPRVVEFTHDDYVVVFKAMRALMTLADVLV